MVSVNTIKLQEAPKIDLYKHRIGSVVGGVNFLTGSVMNLDEMARFMTLRGEVVTMTQGANGERVEVLKSVDIRDCNNLKNKDLNNLTQTVFQGADMNDYNKFSRMLPFVLTSTPKTGTWEVVDSALLIGVLGSGFIPAV